MKGANYAVVEQLLIIRSPELRQKESISVGGTKRLKCKES